MSKVNITKKKSLKHGTLFKILMVMIAACMVTGVAAYLTVSNSLKNQFTVGYVKSEIVEDYNPPAELKPGITFKKKVSIKNTGPNDCYVRVLVTFSSSEIGDKCTLDYDKTNWTYNESDGYWYYNNILKSGKTTVPLFNDVSVSKDLTSDEIQDFDINVYHETSNKKFENQPK